MIKVSIMYPYQADARFDFDYYCQKHMPMVKEKMGASCLFFTAEKGVAGGLPGQPPTYVALGHLYVESIEAFQAGFGPHVKAILADIPNYTDLKPVIQISEVVVERSQ